MEIGDLTPSLPISNLSYQLAARNSQLTTTPPIPKRLRPPDQRRCRAN